MAASDRLRASDADRERVVERLRRAAAEGRITAVELEHRLHRALRAVTYGDLDPLVADLPGGRGRRRRPGPNDGAGPAGQVTASRPGHAGAWAVRTVRANPALLVVVVPVVMMTAAIALAVSMTWLVVLAVAMMVSGHPRTRRSHGHGPWMMGWDGPGPGRYRRRL